jgi:hypothetical protein
MRSEDITVLVMALPVSPRNRPRVSMTIPEDKATHLALRKVRPWRTQATGARTLCGMTVSRRPWGEHQSQEATCPECRRMAEMDVTSI